MLMDGAAQVTQCHIVPGQSFTYAFVASESGTHWYHSHSGVQRTDGAYGPLIVLDSNELPPKATCDKEQQGYVRRQRVIDKTTLRFAGDFTLLVQDWIWQSSLDHYSYGQFGTMK